MTALTAATAWEQAPAAPGWEGPPVWVHSDLMPGNLLVADGRLVGLRPSPRRPRRRPSAPGRVNGLPAGTRSRPHCPGKSSPPA
ncbi:phosphotransferase, partial [Streptomyces antimycoticus]|uniref:phosphotransferase n=1 Tax=Streptomyces antimycoticus TaxID=68175 RepID=UPI003F4D8F98